jgi:hypothetical protein
MCGDSLVAVQMPRITSSPFHLITSSSPHGQRGFQNLQKKLKARWAREHRNQIRKRVVIARESESIYLHLLLARLHFDPVARLTHLYYQNRRRYLKFTTICVINLSEVRRSVFSLVRDKDYLLDRSLLEPHSFERTADAGAASSIDALEGALPIALFP